MTTQSNCLIVAIFVAVILLSCSVVSLSQSQNSTTTEEPAPTTTFTRTKHLKELHKVPGDVRIESCYFVHVLMSVSESRIHELVEELRTLDANASLPEFNAKIMFTITKLGYGFSAKLSDEALYYVRTHDIVGYVEEDELFLGGTQTNISDATPTDSKTVGRHIDSWGLDILDNYYATDNLFHPPCNLTGKGVDVYVLDTGIEYSHTQFEGRALYPGCDIIDDNSDEQRRGQDCNGHGTSVASIIGGRDLGVAPGSTIFSIRVLACNRTGSSSSVVKGLECMLEHRSQRGGRPAVINLSLFGRKAKMMKRAIDVVIESGLSVVALSGNVDTTSSDALPMWLVKDSCRVSPSSIHGVITVAGSTKTLEAYAGTKMGTCVDLFAPGKEVTTALNVGSFCPNCVVKVSGSSFAAPHVAGAVALLLEKCPNLPPWRIKNLLLSKMTVANALSMSTIRRRYRDITPNLLLQLTSKMCSIQC